MSGAGRAWIDGAARGNPGEAGFGVHFESDGRSEEIAGFLGRATNNVAEYTALLAALTYARRLGLERLQIYSDSQLLVRQVSGAYRVKAPRLRPLFLKVLEQRRGIPRVELTHIARQENRRADEIANRAIDARIPPPEWLESELPTR